MNRNIIIRKNITEDKNFQRTKDKAGNVVCSAQR